MRLQGYAMGSRNAMTGIDVFYCGPPKVRFTVAVWVVAPATEIELVAVTVTGKGPCSGAMPEPQPEMAARVKTVNSASSEANRRLRRGSTSRRMPANETPPPRVYQPPWNWDPG